MKLLNLSTKKVYNMEIKNKRLFLGSISFFFISLLLGLFAYGLFFADDPKIIPTILLDKAAPQFKLSDLDGEQILSENFKGSPTVINFWASWCIPCRQEAVELQQAWNEFSPHGLQMLGVAVGDTTTDAKKFIEKYGVTFLNAQDTSNGDLLLDFGVTGIPETFFIDSEGIIKKKHYGAVTYDEVANFFQNNKTL